jgi:hypothetical protein
MVHHHRQFGDCSPGPHPQPEDKIAEAEIGYRKSGLVLLSMNATNGTPD